MKSRVKARFHLECSVQGIKLLNIQNKKNLLAFNTLAFESIAECFTSIENERQIKQSLHFAEREALPYQVISGGSNLLLPAVVPGLTLHMQLKGRVIIQESQQQLVLRIAAGEDWHELVEYTVNKNWQGLENLALIPGLVGASPVQNIGAYGTELADVFVATRAYDTQCKRIVELSRSQCKFNYRDSIFKRNKKRYIILSVDLQLSKQWQRTEVKYKALNDYFNDNSILDPSIRAVFDGVCAIRAQKLPDPKTLANAGSFFKNPCISVQQYTELRAIFPEIVGFSVSETEVKLAAAWLIEYCGWKGFLKAGVGVYAHQSLVLVHFGGASLAQLLALADEIKESIYNTFQVQLEIEPQLFT